jgi:acylphosphatase
MKVGAHVLVEGTVQGVNFRYYTKQEAKRCSVSGWVRNLPDGRVEAVFEGEREDVERMIEFCRKGPSSAEISNVEVKWEIFKGEFKEFEIRY